MKLTFLKPNDSRLTQASNPIPVDSIKGPETKRDLERMYDVAYAEQKDRSKPVLVGVSASQLGIPKRIMLVDVAADGRGNTGDLRTFINPQVTDSSEDTTEWYEGCYSTAPICGVVERPNRITVSAFSPEGEEFSSTLEGYIARIFLHELDHLDGKVFIDRIEDAGKLHRVLDHEYPKYRDQEGWRSWQALATLSDWESLRNQD